MTTPLHFRSWPEGLPRHLTPAETSLFYNLEVSATRFPGKPCLIFYGTPIAFAEFKEEAELLAGFLEKECAVRKGDRVLLLLQNSPQFVLAYYAVLRANAVVVPVSSMSVTDELRHYVQDSGCRTAIVGQELYPQMRPLLGSGLDSAVVAAYSDYLKEPTDLRVPDFVRAGRQEIRDAGVTLWGSALARGLRPGPLAVGPDDLCVMPYTSGTTGRPKGCMHTHRTAMHTIMGGVQWFGGNQDAVTLAVLPFFHVTGMQGGMNMPLFSGSTVVLLPRWDREVAGMLIERHRVTSWTAVPTMVVDFLSNPNIDRFDLSSISRMSGGGAAMPEAIAQRLHDLCGLTYVEGYGLSETIAATHINPPRRSCRRCAIASGIAAPPPLRREMLERSNRSMFGLLRKSTTMVGTAVQLVTPWRSISMPATSRSQRGRSTTVLPEKRGMFMPPCMPVTWKKGSTASVTASWFPPNHCTPPMIVCMAVRCVCMHPLGRPVVPEVYGITHRSSGPTVSGPGRRPRASAELHRVTPASRISWRPAQTKSGTFKSVGTFK
jgi:acyl-CoA synthetase (AMP-forming)/AMP-acid ligase II